jgi:Spy/CpxP family protein refolding chaperone
MNSVAKRLLALGAAGAVALGVGGMALAQDQNQAAPKAAPHHRMRGEGRHGMLNLTPEQREKVAALRKQFHEQFLQILTPDQRKQLEERKAQHAMGGDHGMRRGHGMRGRMAKRLNLTDDQKARLKAARSDLRAELKFARANNTEGDAKAAVQAAREKFRSAMDQILTPEQREQMKSLRGHRNHQAPQATAPEGA